MIRPHYRQLRTAASLCGILVGATAIGQTAVPPAGPILGEQTGTSAPVNRRPTPTAANQAAATGPVCAIEGASNCQLLDIEDNRVAASDLSFPPNGVTHADDFVPAGVTLTQICFWGTYLDPNAADGLFDCTGTVTDNFRVRVYDDVSGLPGNLLAERSLADISVLRGAEPGSGFETTYGIVLQEYTLALLAPIVLPQAGITYFLEIANDTSEPPGNTCYWHWAQTFFSGNNYSAAGTDDRPAAEGGGSGYKTGSARLNDLVFCLGDSGGGVNFSPPAGALGGCCRCLDQSCSFSLTLADCLASGTLGFTGIADIAVDPITSIIYGADSDTDQLISIDSGTGEGVPVGLLGFDLVPGGSGGLAYDPNSGTLYGTDGSNLITINKTTGAAAVVGAIGPAVPGLAFDPNTNTLFGTDGANLLTISVINGSGTSVGFTGFENVRGLTFDPNTNTLFGTANLGAFPDPVTTQLITVNTGTGAGTPVGPFGFDNVWGLAFNSTTDRLYAQDGIFVQLLRVDTTTGESMPPGAVWEIANAGCDFVCADATGDYCATDTIPIVDGLSAFDTSCTTTDGPTNVDTDFEIGAPFGSDIWFSYTAPCVGAFTASLCATGQLYDSILAVYHDPLAPNVCPCPGDSSLLQVGLANDEGCSGIADAGPGILSRSTSRGDCWLIRVGGYQSATGRGFLDIACEGAFPGGQCCNMSADPPVCLGTLSETACNDLGTAGGFTVHFDLGVTCNEGCPEDCNNNAIPDADDIANLTSADCNTNGIPDECEPDCNANNIPDDCDIRDGPSLDCNGNGVPDECELGGNDCNANSIPDDCDIVACSPGDVTCDDCNLNGRPDFCDVPAPAGNCTVGCSADVGADGVPDECAEWDGGGVGSDLSDPDNFGGVVPEAGVSLTVDGGVSPALTGSRAVGQLVVNLGAAVSVDSLRLLNGAVLTAGGAIDEDLTLLTEGGMLLQGDPSNPLLKSRLLVANDRVIDASLGQFVLGAGSEYTKDPAAAGPATASLLAANVVISRGVCPGPSGTDGGLLELTDQMSLSVTGDIVIRGLAAGGCPSGSEAAASRRGINVFPKFRTIGGTSAASSLVLDGSGELVVNSTGGDPNEPTMTLTGDFQVRSTDETRFNWTSGLLLMSGTGPQMSRIGLQTFEVAGFDFGPKAIGLGELGNGNFSMDRIELAPGSNVRFVNDVLNTVSASSCTEALYVRELTLRAGATLTLTDANVYYGALIDEGATIIETNCGRLSPVCQESSIPQPDQIGEDPSTKNRFLSFLAGDAGSSQAVRVTFGSLPAPYDSWNGAEMWVGPTSQVSEAGADVVPAGGPTFTAATLQCTPFYTDWSSLGTIHVFHEGIVPDGSYLVDAIDKGCDAGLAASFSGVLPMTTAIHGDTVLDLSQTPPLPPNGPPVDVVDALGVLGAFSSVPDAIIKARADLEPACLDLKINVTDVLSSLSGFTGLSYPFTPTAADPCNSTCQSVLP